MRTPEMKIAFSIGSAFGSVQLRARGFQKSKRNQRSKGCTWGVPQREESTCKSSKELNKGQGPGDETEQKSTYYLRSKIVQWETKENCGKIRSVSEVGGISDQGTPTIRSEGIRNGRKIAGRLRNRSIRGAVAKRQQYRENNSREETVVLSRKNFERPT